MAFAVAELAFGYLNSSTAFLGSIIIGNGINYAIVLMSRYEEHRARGDDPHEALRCALAGTWRGTLVASIAASAAYASLMVTSFRGFYQFGVMGAVARSSAGSHLHGPAGDAGRARPPRRGGRPVRARRWCWARGPFLQRAARPFGGIHRAGGVAWSALRHFLKDPFEYDFRKLNAEAEDDRGREAVQPQPQRPVRPLAVADDPAGRLASRRSSR